MINNRQSGRRRGRGGGNNQRPQGGGRADSGHRIDNRARGNAAQLLEKYRSLAADAQRQGDRVNTEYYLQFADHYFRVLSETRARQEEAQGQAGGHQGGQQQRRPQPADPFRDQFADFEDGDDFGAEGEAIRPGEQMMATPAPQPSAPAPQRREEQPRRESRFEARRGDEAGERAPRSPRYEAEEPSDAAAPAPVLADEQPAEAPRRRGRPPRRAEPQPASTADDHAAEPDRLPPAIGLPPVANDSDEAPVEEAPRPRRRRVPRAAAPVAE